MTEPGTPPRERYSRQVAVRLLELSGSSRREALRHERGIAERSFGAPFALEARSLAPEAPLCEPPPTSHLERVAKRLAGLRAIASHTSVELARSDGFEGRYEARLLVTLLSVRTAAGVLHRTRLGTTLSASDVAADVTELRQAARLAPLAAPIPRPLRVRLEAAVAAPLLASLWLAWPRAALLPEPRVVELCDDARPEGGPLGAPFDARGEPTESLSLSDPEQAERLPWQCSSFADMPRRGPLNLRLQTCDPGEPQRGADFRALALEDTLPLTAGKVRFGLLGRDSERKPARLSLELGLDDVLEAVEAAGDELYWTAALGACGSPWLMLRLASR